MCEITLLTYDLNHRACKMMKFFFFVQTSEVKGEKMLASRLRDMRPSIFPPLTPEPCFEIESRTPNHIEEAEKMTMILREIPLALDC